VDKGLEIKVKRHRCFISFSAKALNQQIKEISEKYEYEAKRLRENIGELERRKLLS